MLKFTYFADPVVFEVPEPSCGPAEGYTQITLKGKDFVEFGLGKAKCIFNGTYFMNATVLDFNTMVCDTPPLESFNGDMFYNVSVSLDGEYVTNATGKFYYYNQPSIASVSPAVGPLAGGTKTVITGSGFNQSNVCALRVRFGQTHVLPSEVTKNRIVVESPTASVPGSVVVSLSGNNQQFLNDKTIHFRDPENTFEFMQDFFIESVQPKYVSNGGNSPVTLKGMHFNQFKFDNGTQREVPILCRFVDASGSVIGSPRNTTKVTDSHRECLAPKASVEGDVALQLSVNGQQWQNIDHPVKFYNGPRVTAVNPTFGVTKNPRNQKLEISGENFQCPSGDCSKIKVRFTNFQGHKIFMNGRMSETGSVFCDIPKYPAPETLDVDVTFNDQDYTNNGVQFGYLDPFIEDVEPKLISATGSTKLTLRGYGFVQVEESKSLVAFKAGDESLTCSGAPCTKTYSVVDERTATTDTIEQSQVAKSDKNIGY